MRKTNLEREAKEFLDNKVKENEPEKLRKDLIQMLEWFIDQLKKKGP
tara:strand:+ start:268 stop:408 length:141 start_codon:yes stop_codon:yes gene_type:complete